MPGRSDTEGSLYRVSDAVERSDDDDDDEGCVCVFTTTNAVVDVAAKAEKPANNRELGRLYIFIIIAVDLAMCYDNDMK